MILQNIHFMGDWLWQLGQLVSPCTDGPRGTVCGAMDPRKLEMELAIRGISNLRNSDPRKWEMEIAIAVCIAI